jgi:hypothetical protein
MVLERLDRLTLEEAAMTQAQILEVVYGFVQNMRVVMDVEQNGPGLSPAGCSAFFCLDNCAPIDHVWDALGKFVRENELVLCLTEH